MYDYYVNTITIKYGMDNIRGKIFTDRDESFKKILGAYIN